LKTAVHDEDLISFVNSHPNSTWTAGFNKRWASSTLEDVKFQCGVLEGGEDLPVRDMPESELSALSIPDSFDSRSEWGTMCNNIDEVRDQGTCGSCWAVAAAGAMTDRICIQSNGDVQDRLSEEDLLSCCGFTCGNGCNGGYPSSAWGYFKRTGLVTGGTYGSGDGCYPYEIAPCSHHVDGSYPKCDGESRTPRCKKSCLNDLTWSADKHTSSTRYGVSSRVAAIQAEIMNNGPVEASFTVYGDFPTYKSGVYRHLTGSYLGGHAVKMVGWGVESGTPYWLIVNSWNNEWGDQGTFKILRGNNECGIEGGIVAGMV
jgi:cathepsin B